MNTRLCRLGEWLRLNSLTLNSTKLHYVIFHRRRRTLDIPNLDIILNGFKIERARSTKFLGMHLDDNLSFQIHITSIVRRLSKYVPIMYNLRKFLPIEALRTIYNGIIYPNLFYGNPIWGSSAAVHIKPLLILQKKLIRIMCYKSRTEHTAPLFKFLYLLTLDKITKYATCSYVFKILQRLGGAGIFEVYENPYETRRSAAPTLTLPPIVSKHGRQSLRWTGPKAWNDLPQSVRLSTSSDDFKIKLKKYLIQQQ